MAAELFAFRYHSILALLFRIVFFCFPAVQKRGPAASEVGSGMLVEHSGRAPRLEMVSFKKLNKGTLAMGVVFKVGDLARPSQYCCRIPVVWFLTHGFVISGTCFREIYDLGMHLAYAQQQFGMRGAVVRTAV